MGPKKMTCWGISYPVNPKLGVDFFEGPEFSKAASLDVFMVLLGGLVTPRQFLLLFPNTRKLLDCMEGI